MKKIVSILFSMIIMSASLFTYSAFAKANKVAICHNIGNGGFVVIVISENAAAMHIDLHGDFEFFGECDGGGLPQ
ncbi:MAG: hypothetical protein COA71_08285 [SAR86 cluster bacterium]|uniref:Uncharacterized protein n=1 Tax=SAR86 cluster bacterium TaxID=2030880 RepID=A0A2A5CDF5_9GAMM|nr:hypothetical protein [bacterium AH-315-I11]PCJ41545.1 MAG: hypothetical protein COA71_08285 [SAR86 cluster bacterium]